MRGKLTDEIQAVAQEFLHRDIDTTELRLYPYLDYVMKNEQKIDPKRLNTEDRVIFIKLKSEGHMEGGMTGLSMTKEFYNYINQVLWIGYVVNAYGEA